MKGIWVPLSGAIAQQQQVDTIANNVANANTPGFKKDALVFKEYLTALEKNNPGDMDLRNNKEWKPEDFYHSQGAERAYVKVDGSYTDFTQGQLSPTQNPLDLALNGKGFFEILTPTGTRFTRKGNFTLDGQGKLVNSDGHYLLSKIDKGSRAGETPLSRTITVPPSSSLMINLQGEVYSGNAKIADLSVVEFKDAGALKKEGNAAFINSDVENINQAVARTVVHQGFVEESNVNSVEEMATLMKANRNFESIQKALKAYDAMSEKGINEISRF